MNWQPIETAPAGKSVLACNSLGYVGRAILLNGKWEHIGKPTHWMPLPAMPALECETCNGHGMIGGPSFYDPGEGGVECPDCVGSVGAALDRMDALLDPANGLLTVHSTSATAIASRADMALIRAALAAKESP